MRFSLIGAKLRPQNLLLKVDRPHLIGLLAGAFIGVSAVILALLTVLISPLISVGLVLGIGAGLYILTNLQAGLYLVIAMIALLPFATLPFKLALTPTLLDVALGGFLLVYLFEWMTGRRTRFRFVPAHALIVIFIGFMIFSFVAGLGHASITPNVLRKFVELVISVSLPLTLVDVCRDGRTLRRLGLVILICGVLQALIGIGLFLMNDASAERLLNNLGRFGYPQGGVIRYVEDDPSLGERAIGTWVDPNAYGGYLLMIASLAGVQALSKHSLVGKRWIGLGVFGLVSVAVLLTQSRGAWLALVVATLLVAVLRYRWLLAAGALGGLILLSLPFMQSYVARLTEGLTGEDLATQMRLGEYKDALTLIGRYPLIGVGFVGAPDRDIYLGVSSTYLKIANQTGLIGLSLFVLTLLEVFRYGLAHWRALTRSPEILAVWLGCAAGIAGVMVAGVVDHYYFNLDFHASATMLWLFVGMALAATRITVETPQP